MDYIEFAKQQLLSKIDDLSQKLHDLELLNTDFPDLTPKIEEEGEIPNLFQLLPGAIYQTDLSPNRSIINISSQCFNLLGYFTDELLGEGKSYLMDLVHPADKDNVINQISSAINSNQIFQIQYRMIKKDGKIIWVYDQGVAVLDKNENVQFVAGFLSDITEKVETETAHKEIQRRLFTLISTLSGMVYRCLNDEVWTMEFMSEGCKELTGYHPDIFLTKKKKTWQDIIHPDDRIKVHNAVDEGLKNRSLFKISYRILTSDNKIKHVWEQGHAVFNESDKAIALEGFITDISERVKNMEILESERDFSNMLVDNSPGYIVTATKEGIVTSINESMISMLGVPEEEIIGKNLMDSFIPPEETESVKASLRKVIEKKKAARSENYLINSAGESILVEWYRKPIFKDGMIESIYSFGINITEKHNAEMRRQRILEMEKALTLASVELIKPKPNLEKVLKIIGKSVNVDRAYIFNLHSGGLKMSNKFEYCAEGIEPQKEFLQNLDTGIFPWWMEKLRNREPIIVSDLAIMSPEAHVEKSILEEQDIKSIIVVPIFSKSFGLKGFMGFDDTKTTRIWEEYEVAILRVIAEMISNFFGRIEYEDRIIVARDEAEKSEKLKSEFLAQISHEIRTPINVMLSFSSLLRERFLTDDADEELELSFNSINNAGRRLIRTIDLLLNMSEMQADSYDYDPKVFDLNLDVVYNLIPEFSELAKSKGLEFKSTFKKGKDFTVYADQYTVNQILANLVDNAIKYTKTGVIEIAVGIDRKKRCYVDVIDTGIGISKKYIPQLFDAFSQEDKGYTRKFEGSGLGLALVKKYCDLNGALIEVSSKKRTGSKFRIIFPKYEEHWDTT